VSWVQRDYIKKYNYYLLKNLNLIIIIIIYLFKVNACNSALSSFS
jgi:hypothetical protein